VALSWAAPSVEDDGLIAALNSAGHALFVSALTGRPASRYGLRV